MRSPLNAAAWGETQQLSGLAATMPPAYSDVWTPVVAARQPTAQAKVDPRSGRFAAGIPRWRAALAASAMAACLAVFFAPAIKLRLQADYNDGDRAIAQHRAAGRQRSDIGARQCDGRFLVPPASGR